jgi:uncharacterized protein YdhG (YjbR/CyaY superfamily)
MEYNDDTAMASSRIDATIAVLPSDVRDALQALRETIAAAAPEAVEAISYGMPAFRYRGRALVSYAAFKSHCSLFPMSGTVLDAHRAELTGFVTAKGTVQFTPAHRLPTSLVVAIVHERMMETDAASAHR